MQNTLVSVVIICYNAENYILDTLESVKNQTYQNIELIISDDCSTDNTLIKVKMWLNNNVNRFNNVILSKTKSNSGVAINNTNGCKLANGEWIKVLAGDDLLPGNSIELFIEYINKNNIDTICCAKSVSFATANNCLEITNIQPDPYTEKVFKMDSKNQYKKMLYEYIILIPISALISKKLYETIGYYDETFPEIEDHPFFLKVAKNNIKIHYNDQLISYLHRTNINSISQSTVNFYNISAFDIGGKLHRQDIRFALPNIPKYHIIYYYHFYIDLFRRYFIIHILKNKKNLITSFVNKFFLCLDPYFVKRKTYNLLMYWRNKY